MGNPTMWFEVAATDREAMKGFYSGLFDWKLNDMEAMPYTGVDTGGEGIPGGIGQAPEGNGGHVTFYVEVDDVAASLSKAETLGGSTVMPPMEIPSGEIALFADPEGHVVGLMRMDRAG
ncbi:MAG TPA: VOC family protein [Solirubrobacterales bacterium]|nr:VOC family protein [Solirubrobacterales bacterium]